MLTSVAESMSKWLRTGQRNTVECVEQLVKIVNEFGRFRSTSWQINKCREHRRMQRGFWTPLFEYQKSIAIACQWRTKALPRNYTRSKLSLTTYEVFSSSPTFLDIDLAGDIHGVQGIPKVILSIIGDVVHRFTAHGHRTHVYTTCPLRV